METEMGRNRSPGCKSVHLLWRLPLDWTWLETVPKTRSTISIGDKKSEKSGIRE